MTNRNISFRLPHLFKPVGFAVSAVVVLLLFLSRFDFFPVQIEAAVYFKYIFIAGLFVAAISKDKREGETFGALRFRTVGVSLMFGMLYTVFQYFTGPQEEFDLSYAYRIVIMILLFYHLMYGHMKRWTMIKKIG